MMTRTRFAALALCLCVAPAQAALNVLACEPEWAALAKEIGGALIETNSATTAMQDPHHIQARPSLIARARNADLIICTGAELEIGWLPILLQQSGNAKIQPGQPGYLMAADSVRMLEVPERVDRSAGDVHASGNPHIQTDPRNFQGVAAALAERLQQIDVAHRDQYEHAHQDFKQRWAQALERWHARGAPLHGVAVVSQHKAFAYLYDWLGLKEVAVLEPKPGIEPTASHLRAVVDALKRTPAKMVLYASYQDPRPSQWLSDNANLPAVKVPFTVGGSDTAKDLFTLFDDTLERLIAALAPR